MGSLFSDVGWPHVHNYDQVSIRSSITEEPGDDDEAMDESRMQGSSATKIVLPNWFIFGKSPTGSKTM
jgi:hypothetical protein